MLTTVANGPNLVCFQSALMSGPKFWILRQFGSMRMRGICGIVVCGLQVQGVAEAMKTAPRLARTFPFNPFHRFSCATFNYPKAALRHEDGIQSQANMFSFFSHFPQMD